MTNDTLVCGRSGDGTFGAKAGYDTGTGPDSIVVADLSGDGKLDVVVVATDGATVNVLLGGDNGTLRASVDYDAAGFGPRWVAVGDVDGDGTPDLAVANPDLNTISLLLGRGDGTFRPHIDLGGFGSPASVAVADLNNDGMIDLAVPGLARSTVNVVLVGCER